MQKHLKCVIMVTVWIVVGCSSKKSGDGSGSGSPSSVALGPSSTPSVPLSPSAAAARGFELWGTKKYDEAVKLWDSSCEAGDASGCTGVGLAFMWGNGKPKDYAKAWELLKPACEGGTMRACATMGQLYLNGWGVPKDLEKARPLWEKACDQGEPRGCYWLGLSFRTKDGPPGWHDEAASKQMLQKACDGGYKEACDETAAIARDEKKKALRDKVKREYWDEEPDAMCTGKSLPPYRWTYKGGTFAEDKEVAEGDGCKALYSIDNTVFCCPKKPVNLGF